MIIDRATVEELLKPHAARLTPPEHLRLVVNIMAYATSLPAGSRIDGIDMAEGDDLVFTVRATMPPAPLDRITLTLG